MYMFYRLEEEKADDNHQCSRVRVEQNIVVVYNRDSYIEVADLEAARVRRALDERDEVRRRAMLEAHVLRAVDAHAVPVNLDSQLHVDRAVQLERNASVALLFSPDAAQHRVAHHYACACDQSIHIVKDC